MGLLEHVVLTDSVQVAAPPESVYAFLMGLVDDASYRAWHPEDHVSFRWVQGEPWQEGSVVHAEEYLHGKLHKLKFRVDKVVPNRELEYVPTSRLLRIYCPKNRFVIEPTDAGCRFTAEIHLRIGSLVKTLAKSVSWTLD